MVCMKLSVKTREAISVYLWSSPVCNDCSGDAWLRLLSHVAAFLAMTYHADKTLSRQVMSS